MEEFELDGIIKIELLGYQFIDKPLIIGGLAMEFYNLRKHGDDVDFIISGTDYQNLKQRFPNERKDVWGDFGIKHGKFEMFRSIYKFDYEYYCHNAIEMKKYKIVDIDMLFRMQVFAMEARPKNYEDVKLIKMYYEREQNKKYKEYLDKNIKRYIGSENGIFEHVQYDDE